MCGRFANATSQEQLKSAFKVQFPGAAGHNRPPCWNIAPGMEIEVVMPGDAGDASGRRLVRVLWGMANPKSARPLVNARGETMFERPSFADSARHHRCLVVATGWYEWKAPGKPYFARYRDGAPMAIGGIYRRMGGGPCAAIVTRPASGELDNIHHRAPLLLDGRMAEQWLEPSSGQSSIEGIVGGARPGGLELYPVLAAVGNVNEDHENLALRDDNHGQPPSAQMEMF